MARMRARVDRVDDFAAELLADERVRRIDWSHPALERLSDPARLIYASLIDGLSEEARETLAGVDVVWRNRDEYRKAASTTPGRRSVLDSICSAVDELIDAGLLLLLDERSVSGGWVRRPWEGPPS